MLSTFDCIGFINFVLSLTTSQRWGFSIPQYAAGNITPAATAIPLDAPPADADVVISIQPYRLSVADGQVLQAPSAHGVHADETYKGKPDHPGGGDAALDCQVPSVAQKSFSASGITTWGNGGTDTRRW